MSRIPIIHHLSEVESREVEWLWPGRIPFGKLTVLDGDPGTSKSTVLLDLAARLSKARELPLDCLGHKDPIDSLLLAAEDSEEDTLRPRLEAADADLTRIHTLPAIMETTRQEVELLDLTRHLEELELAICEYFARLVVIDPLSAFLGLTVDSWRDQDIRRVLYPLSQIADRQCAAIVLIRHLRKADASNPLYRGGGSIGIVGTARSALMIERDPDGPENQRVLLTYKSNLCRRPDTLVYRVYESLNLPGRLIVEWLRADRRTAEEIALAKQKAAKASWKKSWEEENGKDE